MNKYGRYLLADEWLYHRTRAVLIANKIDLEGKTIVDFGAGFCDIIEDLLCRGARKGVAYECSPDRLNRKSRMRSHPKLELRTTELPCRIDDFFDIGMMLGNTSELFVGNLQMHKTLFQQCKLFILEAKPYLICLIKKEAEEYYNSYELIGRTILKREMWLFSHSELF